MMTVNTEHVLRRSVLVALVLMLWSESVARAQNAAPPGFRDRVEGLLIGAAIGDAAGGPYEFQPPHRPARIDRSPALDATAIRELRDRFALTDYELVDAAAPFGPWRDHAPAGTVTDDTRFKILLMRSLDGGTCTPDAAAFAREVLDWHADDDGPFGDLPGRWLDEFALAARWVLGERDPERAAPPERQWGGIATMAGQMPFLPVAALHAGHPTAAYEAVWAVNFMDTGWGRDVTAALAAGLAHALVGEATWESVEHVMRSTDPFGFGRVPWVERRLERWLDEADSIGRDAAGRPDRLYELLESRLGAETWWEAHVPLVVVFAAARTAEYDALATMQLILEFGHDTDSYLQLAGAIFGALHGAEEFPPEARDLVASRLDADFGESVTEWAKLLVGCSPESRR